MAGLGVSLAIFNGWRSDHGSQLESVLVADARGTVMDITGIGSIADFAGKVLDKIFPDPAAAMNAKIELLKAQQAGELAELAAQWDNAKGQIAVNQAEASSGNAFASSWRPFIGWTCGVAFAYKFVLAPVAALALTAAGHPITLPVLDFGEMMPVLFGMLGLGAMRSYEKVKGVSK